MRVEVVSVRGVRCVVEAEEGEPARAIAKVAAVLLGYHPESNCTLGRDGKVVGYDEPIVDAGPFVLVDGGGRV